MTSIIRDDLAPPRYEEADQPHYDALEQTGFFGQQAAGAVLRAADSGRFMLMKRSAAILEPHTWGNCGGAHHADEAPEDAVRREIREETGWEDEIESVHAGFVFTSGNFVYRNFVAVVPSEFTPSLGWEADEHRWCTIDDLPAPLHFGIEALLKDPASRELLSGPTPSPKPAANLEAPRP